MLGTADSTGLGGFFYRLNVVALSGRRTDDREKH